MTKRPYLFLMALLAIALLALAACGDDDEEATETGSPAATATARATGSPGAASSPSAQQPSDNELTQLLAKAKNAEFQVSYDIKAPAEGGQQDGKITMSVKGAKSSVAISTKQGGENLDVTIIEDGQNAYICGNLTGDDKACFKIPSSGPEAALADTLTQAFQSLNPTALAEEADFADLKRDGNEKIAGRDGECFKGTSNGQEGRICVDKDLGIPLLVQAKEAEGNVSLKATKVSAKVSDDAFKPPYKVKDFSELLNNSGN